MAEFVKLTYGQGICAGNLSASAFGKVLPEIER